MKCRESYAGYPSIDKPWLKYYDEEALERVKVSEVPIYEHLRRSCEMYPNDVAIEYLGKKITYGELLKEVDKTAQSFRSLGVTKGDVVAVVLPNIPQNVYAIYALNSVGAIPDLIDLRAEGKDLAYFLNATEARIALVCDLFLVNAIEAISQTSLQVLVVASPYDSLPFPLKALMKLKRGKLPTTNEARMLEWSEFVAGNLSNAKLGDSEESCSLRLGDDAACIFHTSGTTSLPKGVVLSNKSFNAMVEQYRICGLEFSAGDSFLNQVPPFLAYNTILALHLPLSLGMRVIMLPAYEPENFAKILQKHRPNHVVAGPQCWRNVLENRGTLTDASSLKTLASGSDSMRIDEKKAADEYLQSIGCNFQIIEGYGMTEVGSAATTNLSQTNVYGTMGIPLPLTSVCVYDNETNSEMSIGEEGEVCISGPTIMDGYLADEDATRAVLKCHDDGIPWIHTGDLGHLDESGHLHLSGRIKRMIVSHEDMKISPFAIENAILEEKEVADCCVVGVPDTAHGHGQIPCAFVVLKNSLSEEGLASLKARCITKQSRENKLAGLSIIDSLPVTPNGKIDYRKLEEIAAERRADE